MNFKAQFGKNIHKLPAGISSFQELIYSIRQLLGKKLPENYTFKYSDTDKDLVGLESEDDFEAALSFLKANNINSLKVQVVKETKPSLELFSLPPDFSFMSCSSIIRQAVEEQAPQKKENAISPEIREQILESNIVEVDLKMKEQSETIEKASIEKQQAASISNEQNQKEEKTSKEILENQPNLSINGLPQNREELQQLVEEIVEEKLKNLLQNYQLIPKQLSQNIQNKKVPKNDNEDEERKENASEIMNSNSNIQLEEKISEKDKFSEIDKKKLRAILKSDPESEVKVGSGNPYVWSFNMQNSGAQSWPINTFFQCLQGPNVNQKIEVGAVKPSSQFNIVLPLDAPFNPDKYPEVWSLVYDTEDRQTVTFGPKVRYTLVVSPVVPQAAISNPSKPQSSQSSISITETTELKVNNKTIELANKMKNILGGDLKKYVEFLSISDHSKLSPDDAINTYLENKKF